MKKTKFLFAALAVLVAVVFILIPLPSADLYIRITFEEIAGDQCVLYYATDTADFCKEQSIITRVDRENNQATFLLDGSLEKHITGLRIDFPDVEDLLCIKTITASSAGIIQEEYNPCHFFAPQNIAHANEADITLVKPRNRVYISTGASDPFLILSQGLTAELISHYSHFTLTRLVICLLVAAGWFLNRKNIFKK